MRTRQKVRTPYTIPQLHRGLTQPSITALALSLSTYLPHYSFQPISREATLSVSSGIALQPVVNCELLIRNVVNVRILCGMKRFLNHIIFVLTWFAQFMFIGFSDSIYTLMQGSFNCALFANEVFAQS